MQALPVKQEQLQFLEHQLQLPHLDLHLLLDILRLGTPSCRKRIWSHDCICFSNQIMCLDLGHVLYMSLMSLIVSMVLLAADRGCMAASMYSRYMGLTDVDFGGNRVE